MCKFTKNIQQKSSTFFLMALFQISLLCIIIIPTYSVELRGDNLGCFADLTTNSDRKTDVVIYSDRTIIPFKQKQVSSQRQEFTELNNITTDNAIQSVSAFDFNKNGIADLFVVTANGSDSYALHVYEDNKEDKYIESFVKLELSDPDILIFDATGDFSMDVLGKNKNNEVGYWKSAKDASSIHSFTAFKPLVNMQSDAAVIRMKTVSFIDLDQDCVAELVYMTNDTIKMMKNDGNGGFGDPVSLITFDAEQGEKWQSQMYFADYNKDGMLYHSFSLAL